MRPRFDSADGFTFVDIVIALGLLVVIGGMAVPGLQNIGGAIAHGQAQQMVESELQQARLKAVSTNRIMRVRFNCPVAGQFRTVELIGTPSAPATQDTASNRCALTAYPYPAADRNIVTLPNHDGTVKRLDPRVAFGAAPTIEFRPTGTAHAVNSDGTSGPPLATTGTAITLTKGAVVKTVKVNGLGKVEGVQ